MEALILFSRLSLFATYVTTLGFFMQGCKEDQTFGRLESETEDIRPLSNRTIIEVEIEDIQGLHDYFCEVICDSISAWRANSSLDSQRIDDVNDIIRYGLADTLNVSLAAIDSFIEDIGMSELEFGNLFNSRNSLVFQTTANYLSRLDSVHNANINESNEDLLIIIIDEINTWRSTLDDDDVDAVIEVVKSTYPYWWNNYGECIDPEGPVMLSTASNKERAGELALEDVTGALFGFVLGGPAGSLLGAVRGTLGGAIKLAIDKVRHG